MEYAYFGADGKPTLVERGFARVTYIYDERGNKVEEAYFGTDEKPVLSKGGIARVTYRYDERGNQIEWAYFGIDGAPLATAVEITEVLTGSVAERIGLASGDRLLAYDGETIKNDDQAVALVIHADPGVHKLTFSHGDAMMTREVPAGRLGVMLMNVRAENKLADAPLPPGADQLQSGKR